MNGAVIGKNCLVGAGALIPEGKTYGDRKLILGSPAKVIRELTDQDIEKMHRAAPGYVRRKESVQIEVKETSTDPESKNVRNQSARR